MEEQLPTPVSELLLLNLYLGSVTYLLAVLFVVWMLRRNRARWPHYVLLPALTVLIGFLGSVLVWSIWPFKLVWMFGPIHLPAFISVAIVSVVLLKLAGCTLSFRTKG